MRQLNTTTLAPAKLGKATALEERNSWKFYTGCEKITCEKEKARERSIRGNSSDVHVCFPVGRFWPLALKPLIEQG